MISVIIPAHKEKAYLNRTIDNIFATCDSVPEVIVIDQGGNGKIDERAVVICPGINIGERKAMNLAAKQAKHDFLFRIDAHCDFSPQGWDMMLSDVTGEKTITVAVLTAIYHHTVADEKSQAEAKANDWKDWDRIKGHWYGLAKIVKSEHAGQVGLECKWHDSNRDHNTYDTIERNMGLTGCGFMIRKKFYEEIDGANESLPKMGAIGEEFAMKTWLAGGNVQTRTDVMVGHIFGTGGYNTDNVKLAQQMLYDLYGAHYGMIVEKFPGWHTISLIKTNQTKTKIRTVTVDREDVTDTKDNETDKLIRRKVVSFKYIWYANEHLTESAWTDKQIRKKYAPLAIRLREKVIYYTDDGQEIVVPNETKE